MRNAGVALWVCFLVAACRVDVEPEAHAQIECDADGECPSGWSCDERSRRCLSAESPRPRCGDGIVDADEQCDCGDAADLTRSDCLGVNSDSLPDRCRTDCTNARCGDGGLDGAEECDDGNQNGADGCSALCVREVCGNLVLDPGEACDDGDVESGDGCSGDCRSDETCGNGYADFSGLVEEGCDCGTDPLALPPGCAGINGHDASGCTTACQTVFCGNEVVNEDEACDDGNRTPHDGCSPDCRSKEICGNQVVDAHKGEICDAGELNAEVPDAPCRIDCQPRRCGDGIIDPALEEVCDGATLGGATCASLGFYSGDLACSAACTYDLSTCSGRCGDGVKNGGEECDAFDFGDTSCATQTSPGGGTYYTGALQCTAGCTLVDPSTTCTGFCGDHTRNGVEACDNGDHGGLGCTNVPSPRGQPYFYYGGSLACSAECDGFDSSGCTGYCGDAVANGLETCDTADFDGRTCLTFGFYTGTLTCNADCASIDTINCDLECGDGQVNGPELCDTFAPLGKSCISYGYDIGLLGCSAELCVPDFAGCDVFGWREGPARPQGSQLLRGVWLGPSGTLFVLENNALAVRLPNGSWSVYRTDPSIAVARPFMDMWPLSETDIYLAGTAGGDIGWVYHFNGAGLTQVGADIPARIATLGGTGGDDLFAAGQPVEPNAAVYHFGGSSWTAVPRPPGAPSYAEIRDLLPQGEGDVIAVGAPATLWTCTPTACAFLSPSPPAPAVAWRGVTRLGDGSIAVLGTDGTVGFGVGPNWYWHSDITTTELTAGWGEASDSFLAVGASGGAYFFNGATWQALSTGVSADLKAAFARERDQIYAVGDRVLVFDGVAWDEELAELDELLPSPGNETAGWDCAGMVGFGPSEIFASYGDDGRYFRFNGQTWSDVAPAFPGQIISLSGFSRSDLVFGGGYWVARHDSDVAAGAPTVYSLHPDTGVLAPIGVDGPFYGVSVVPPSTIFAGSNQYGLFMYDGADWSRLEATVRYDDVWAASATAVFGVGSDGALVVWDGDQATVEVSLTSLQAVHGTDERDVFAVGSSGAIFHYDGDGWVPMESPTNKDLYAVRALAPDDVFAAGQSGTILHYNGEAWRLVRSPTARRITAIQHDGGDYVYFAATDGFIARLLYSGSLTRP